MARMGQMPISKPVTSKKNGIAVTNTTGRNAFCKLIFSVENSKPEKK